MPDERQRPSFWKTIPGIITAIGTLIGAVAALITALYTVNVIGYDSEKDADESMQKVVISAGGDKKFPEDAPEFSTQAVFQPAIAKKTSKTTLINKRKTDKYYSGI
ncbi:MAG: hypothetical protein D3917_19435 [Candidatus Electrothrix sp. AX5]|nr:hypothetical protein [Candidatus Electrothrix sp. AX5]